MNYYNSLAKTNIQNTTKSIPPINPDQFCSMIGGLNDNFLNQLVEDARKKGISEADIESGLNFIKSLK